jgi:hypothetical protein
MGMGKVRLLKQGMRARLSRSAAGAIVYAAAAVSMLAAAPSAFGAFGFDSLSVEPANAPAGSNSDVSIDIALQEPEHDLRDLTIHLPPGLVGNPLATPTCSEEQLVNEQRCPDASDVGDVTNNVTAHVAGALPVTLDVQGDLYNVTPRPGEPARFGIILDPGLPIAEKIVLQSGAVLRPSDFGLDSVLTDLPNSTKIAGATTPIDINSVSLTLGGVAGNPPKGFIRLPTSCGTHTVGFDARAYDDQTATGATTFTTDNCGALPFTPELTARAKPEGIGKPVELTTVISQTIEEAGLANAEVILPNGITGNNSLLGITCPRADFEAGSCPANTIVGTASATSPLQSQALTGTVALIQPVVPGLPDIGLDLRGPLALKLTGSLSLATDGRAVTTFAGLPDIPISDFALTFTREPGFVFAGKDLCQSPPLVIDGVFKSFSGADAAVKAPIQLEGCGPSKGGNKKPKAKVNLEKLGSKKPTLKLTVRAGSERIRKATLKMPKGLAFASGKRFDRGIKAKANGKTLPDKAIKNSKRTLRLKGKRAKRIVAKARGGALKASSKARERMRFNVKVVDARGKRWKIGVRSR